MKNRMFQEITVEVKHFMDSIGDGVMIIDKNGKILNYNKVINNILGYNKKINLINQLALHLLSPTDANGIPITKKNAALFESINKGKKIANAIRQFVKKDGSHIWTAITTTPLNDKKGLVKGAIIIIRDITKEKQQEEYRADFAHIASHSLRTPLGNVMWAIEYLLSTKPGALNEKQKNYLDDCYQTLKNMNRLVNDLLSISNIPYKKIRPNWQKVHIEEIYKKVHNDLQYYAKAHNVIIELNSKRKKHLIRADENHVCNIIQNIIENAIRYSFNKTSVKVNFKKEGKFVIFSCCNNGIGIPEHKKKFIFAKFFRAHNAVNKEGNGTGLGLYITKELITLNKGVIWFESEENKTTTFFVKFKAY